MKVHLARRGMEVPVRGAVASISAVLAVTALATLGTERGPSSAAAVTAVLVAGASAALWAVVWALRWPTSREAHVYAVLANASIAAAALAQSDPLLASLACTVFAALAGYIAVFHTPGLLIYNFAVATTVSLIEAGRLAGESCVAVAIGAVLVVVVLNLAVPVCIQITVHGLGSDAMQAEHDHLTGLLTRPAFHRQVIASLDAHPDGHHLVLVVIDLDRFKQLNDAHGHDHGDAALVGVARALQSALSDGGAIGRAGGEEFVVAAHWPPEGVATRVEAIRAAIAASPFDVTASVGSATAHPMPFPPQASQLIGALTAAADDAMYVAKRRGGNQTHNVRWPLMTRAPSL